MFFAKTKTGNYKSRPVKFKNAGVIQNTKSNYIENCVKKINSKRF